MVVAADRMVTYPGFIEFEHPGSKMVQLGDHAIVMVSGDTLIGMRLANDAAAALAGSAGPIAAIAADLGVRYAGARNQQSEQQVLSVRGLNFQTFYANHNSLNGQAVMLTDNQLAQFDLGVELLLAGVDDTGAHIHTVHNPGGLDRNHDPITYAAIGSGAIHVLPSMAGFAHGGTASYPETLFRVYASKRRAEVAPGVGGDTELAVVTRSGVQRLTSADLERLSSLYDKFTSKTNTELKKQLAAFKPEGNGDGDGTK